MQSVLTGNSKRGFEKVKGGKQRNHSLCTYNEPRVEIKTWLLLSFHMEMSQTRQGKTEGDGRRGKKTLRGCRALCMNWHNDFVTQDLEIKHFELFYKRQTKPAYAAPITPTPSIFTSPTIHPSPKRKCSISRLTHPTITERSIHMVIRVCGCECVCVDASAVFWHT